MKKMKKVLALLLAMSMTVAMLAGCGAKEEAPVETPAVETTVEAPAEEVAEVVVDTMILKEADEKMLNTYSMIAVNPEAPFVDADGNAVADVAVNTAGADALIQWLVTDEALTLAAEYGKEEYNLFFAVSNVLYTYWFHSKFTKSRCNHHSIRIINFPWEQRSSWCTYLISSCNQTDSWFFIHFYSRSSSCCQYPLFRKSN